MRKKFGPIEAILFRLCSESWDSQTGGFMSLVWGAQVKPSLSPSSSRPSAPAWHACSRLPFCQPKLSQYLRDGEILQPASLSRASRVSSNLSSTCENYNKPVESDFFSIFTLEVTKRPALRQIATIQRITYVQSI